MTIADIALNFIDNDEDGVIGLDGKLNIRPKYQREFVYDDGKRNAVIDTILKGFPLNVMYWSKNADGTFEIIDGQQRTISFCRYVTDDFTILINGESKGFRNLTATDKEKILNYKLMIYICEGTEKEKLAWFKVINIAGEKLTAQELLNASYTGTWLSHAKLLFSKSKCQAYMIGKDFVNGSPIRQEILETAISWINKGDVSGYMAKHQHSPNANELWNYFENVINWIKSTFPVYRKEMKGLDWGALYDAHHRTIRNATALEEQISQLMIDDEITNQKGIYAYVLTGDQRYLNLRKFTESQRRQKYEEQRGICKLCDKHFPIEYMEADHIDPWSKQGKTNTENCQMLCNPCNRRKSSK